mmetsp:Transcript_48726/g.106118  ORF Transcript_48726/g.106118 Transcript_48726/m.106118 type:complete len:224 (-) Transcript_48726:387-1058(-)
MASQMCFISNFRSSMSFRISASKIATVLCKESTSSDCVSWCLSRSCVSRLSNSSTCSRAASSCACLWTEAPSIFSSRSCFSLKAVSPLLCSSKAFLCSALSRSSDSKNFRRSSIDACRSSRAFCADTCSRRCPVRWRSFSSRLFFSSCNLLCRSCIVACMLLSSFACSAESPILVSRYSSCSCNPACWLCNLLAPASSFACFALNFSNSCWCFSALSASNFSR